MHRSHKNKKNIYRVVSLLGLVQIFLWNALPVSAGLFGGGVSIPSASDWASQIEKRYNLNPDAIRQQGQQFNVTDQKEIYPQVSLYFSPSDPKAGEKLTAIALPVYFSVNDDQLYYTWYLKHTGCDLERAVVDPVKLSRCDLNNDTDVTVEDWKIEAMRILASNEFDYGAAFSRGDYDPLINTTNDNDGYRARFGGDLQVSIPNHCYYHDNRSGTNYEIVKNNQADDTSFDCPSGQRAVCMVGTGQIDPGTIDASATGGSGGTGGTGGATPGGGGGGTGGDASVTGDTFETTGLSDAIAGFPVCNDDNSVTCYTGTPCCVSNLATATVCGPDNSGGTLATCSASGTSRSDLECRHLFPNAPSGFTGNGSFDLDEEQFWHTNARDPDTAENGNKDEANVAGLGQKQFRWNYASGDLLGVVVEGVSMIPTKYNDASDMIMWAFSKNNCPISEANGTGQYQTNQAGYAVSIPTVDIDLNNCLERNLVNPALGGQAGNLDVNVTATPDNPQDDNTGQGDGDTIEVTANVNNAAKSLPDTFYDWKVQIAQDPSGPWANITGGIQALPNGRDLISAVRGNGVNTFRLKLNLKDTDIVEPIGSHPLSFYLSSGNVGYLKFSVDAAENFTAGANRKGNGSVVVKFTTAGDRIQAYLTQAFGTPAQVNLTNTEICSGFANPTDPPDKQALDKLEGKLCRVLSSEIIGLRLDNPADPVTGNPTFSNFSWTINDKSLVCNRRVSPACPDDHQENINFFPVVGNVGDTFIISLTANKISIDPRDSTEKTVTLSRTFKIVDPSVQIVSADLNSAWPKVLGQYVDTTGATFTDSSQNTLEALTGASVTLRANFIPSFLAASFPPKIERFWTVDDQTIGDGASNTIAFTTNKPDGSIYNVGLAAVYRPPVEIRQALLDIWGISSLDSTERYFGTLSQLEHPSDPGLDFGRLTGPKKYLALISSYLPASLLFSLRVLLSIGTILFVSGLLFSVSPAYSETPPSHRRR